MAEPKPVLRDYQIHAVARARSMMGQGKKSICLVAPTGAGKTLIASHVIQSAMTKGKRILFIAHRRELIDQCANKLRDLGIWNYNVILSGHPQSRNPSAPVQIASIQTLIRRVYPEADLIIIDEAHHAAARQYQIILANYPNAYVLGLTATPERLDGKGLDDIFHDLLDVSTIPDLIEQGFLVKPTCFGPNPDEMKKIRSALADIRIRNGDYAEGQLGGVMNNASLVGGIVQHWQKWAKGQQTIVFATSVEHSRAIVDQFKAIGVAAAHLDGSMPTRERDAVIASWKAREIAVVSNCFILTEGFDYPELSCCVLARPTKSVALYLQMVGRVLRTAPGKTSAVVLDHAGNIEEHDAPHVPRVWTLQGMTDRRKKAKTYLCEIPDCCAIFPAGDGAEWWFSPTQPDADATFRARIDTLNEMRDTDWFRENGKIVVCPVCGHGKCTVCGTHFEPGSPETRLIAQCPHCHADYCSDAPPVVREEAEKAGPPESTEGELVLLGGAVSEKTTIKNAFNQLLNEAKEKGRKRGWAWHRLRNQYSEDQIRAAIQRHRAEWWRKEAH